MSYIEIIEENETFEWRPPAPYHESVLTLKRMPASRRKVIQKQHTSMSWKRGQRVEERDDHAIGRLLLDESIVAWHGIYVRRKAEDGSTVRAELECTADTKMLLPEHIKADVVNICVNGETPDEDIESPFEEAVSRSPTTSAGSSMKAIS